MTSTRDTWSLVVSDGPGLTAVEVLVSQVYGVDQQRGVSAHPQAERRVLQLVDDGESQVLRADAGLPAGVPQKHGGSAAIGAGGISWSEDRRRAEIDPALVVVRLARPELIEACLGHVSPGRRHNGGVVNGEGAGLAGAARIEEQASELGLAVELSATNIGEGIAPYRVLDPVRWHLGRFGVLMGKEDTYQ